LDRLGGGIVMRKFEEFLNKINFKKVAKVYVLVSILLLLFCAAAIGFVTRDKIKLALDYEKASDAFKDNGFGDKLKPKLGKLTADSKDILNCIVVDKDNNIIYKANDNLIKNHKKFILTPEESNRKELKDNINKDVVYRVTKEENIIFNLNYLKNHERILFDIDEELYFEKDLANEEVNELNYLVNRETKEKLFLIRAVTPIKDAEILIKAIGVIVGFIFIIYWLGVTLWVYRDADRRKSNSALWGLLALLTNIVGLIIYTMYKETNKLCHKCGAIQDKSDGYCSECGTQINERCKECNSIIYKNQKYCSGCGYKL